jgi:hypothetical protein
MKQNKSSQWLRVLARFLLKQLAPFIAILIVLGRGHLWFMQWLFVPALIVNSLGMLIVLLPFLFIAHLGLCHVIKHQEARPAWWVFAWLVAICVALALALFNFTPWGDGYLKIIYYYPTSQPWLFWLAVVYGTARWVGR